MLAPLGVLALIVVAVVGGRAGFLITPAGLVGATVVAAWIQRDGALLAGETGLLVRHRGTVTRSYRWAEISQANLTRPGFGRLALAVFPDGGPWDVPGPNNAVLVGRVWQWSRPDRGTRDRVEAALRAHGVRITEPFP
ncbi:hypothetical protein [Micromonospora sp. AKA38]|uniref:hypothetical protein n=1 Tax=Micromonospora sp. AKA38 TaxID=2733861 RepID=UPI0022C8F4A8|nr:hypothetical protein [Micromonospora sp. AKA38]GHJ14103.1 hypothetical protein TPA0908_20980 [Micromonospora sp. AKA38]